MFDPFGSSYEMLEFIYFSAHCMYCNGDFQSFPIAYAMEVANYDMFKYGQIMY